MRKTVPSAHVPVGTRVRDPAAALGGLQQGRPGTPGSAHISTSAKVHAKQHVIPGSGHVSSHTKVDAGHHVIPGSGHMGTPAHVPSHAHLGRPTKIDTAHHVIPGSGHVGTPAHAPSHAHLGRPPKVDTAHHVLVGQQYHPAPLSGIHVPAVINHYPQVVHVPPPETYLTPVPVFVPQPVEVVHTPVYTHIETDNVSSKGSGLIAGGIVTLIVGIALSILGAILLSTGNLPWGITVTALGALAIGGGVAMLYYGCAGQEG